MMLKEPTISIVTVVYNCEESIELTLTSVLRQTYSNIEYIVIDGGSKDKTVEIIKSYQEELAVFVSEPDDGLYHAMNKGLGYCSGDFCLFLNAGDAFYETNTVTKMVAGIDSFDDLYFAVAVMTDGKHIFRLRPPVLESEVEHWLLRGNLPNHQATLFPRSFYAKNQYDLHFRITADDDYKKRALKVLKPIFLPFWAVLFELGGLSRRTDNWYITRRRISELVMMRNKHYSGQSVWNLANLKFALKLVFLFVLTKVTGNHWQYELWFNKFKRIPVGEEWKFHKLSDVG